MTAFYPTIMASMVHIRGGVLYISLQGSTRSYVLAIKAKHTLCFHPKLELVRAYCTSTTVSLFVNQFDFTQTPLKPQASGLISFPALPNLLSTVS